MRITIQDLNSLRGIVRKLQKEKSTFVLFLQENQMRRKGEIMKKMQKTYQTISFPPLTEEQKKELQALEEMPDEDIDYKQKTRTVSPLVRTLIITKTGCFHKLSQVGTGGWVQGTAPVSSFSGEVRHFGHIGHF